MRMLEVIVKLGHTQNFRLLLQIGFVSKDKVTPKCQLCITKLKPRTLPKITIHNVNDSTTGMRLKGRGEQSWTVIQTPMSNR